MEMKQDLIEKKAFAYGRGGERLLGRASGSPWWQVLRQSKAYILAKLQRWSPMSSSPRASSKRATRSLRKRLEPGCSSCVIDTGETRLLKWAPVLITRTRQLTLSKKKKLNTISSHCLIQALGQVWVPHGTERESSVCEALLPRGGWAAVYVCT